MEWKFWSVSGSTRDLRFLWSFGFCGWFLRVVRTVRFISSENKLFLGVVKTSQTPETASEGLEVKPLIKLGYDTWGSYGQYSKKIAILKSGKVLDPQNFAKHAKRESKTTIDGYEIKIIESSSRKNIHIELEVPAEAVLAVISETKTSGNFYRNVETSEKYDIVEEEKIEVRENYNKRYYVKYLVTYLKIREYKIELERKQVDVKTELISKPVVTIKTYLYSDAKRWKVVADGDTYYIKDLLKEMSFRWDSILREWYKVFSTKEEADKFAEEVKEKLKEVIEE